MNKMRKLAPFVLVGMAVMFGVSAWNSKPLWDLVLVPLFQENDETQRSIGYVLSKKWTRFSITGNVDDVSVITNASIDTAYESVAQTILPAEADVFPYAVEYRVLDESGVVLSEGVHHHRSRLLQVRDTVTGDILPIGRYEDSDALPAAAQPMRFAIDPGKQIANIELRVHTTGPGVQDVVARLSRRQVLREERLDDVWIRLSHVQRERMAEATAYPAHLLTSVERTELMRNRWRPVGPEGIQEQDYQSRVVYWLDGERYEYLPEAVMPSGLYIDGGRFASIQIPPPAGDIELEFIELPKRLLDGTQSTASQSSQAITLRWFGQSLFERHSENITTATRPAIWRGQFEPGVLQIEAQQALIVRAFHGHGKQRVEITPETLYLRSYVTAAEWPLEFELDHIGQAATPLRIDLRRGGFQRGQGVAPAAVAYELLADDGQVLSRGELLTGSVLSPYDRPAKNPVEGWVTEAQRYYLEASAAATRLRLSSVVPVWVTMYTRPADLPYQVDTDSYLPWVPTTASLPQWFLTRPVATMNTVEAHPSMLIALQERPPKDQLAVRSGLYSWEWVQPQGNWVGRDVLAQIPLGREIRDEAREAVYRPILAGASQQLHISGDPGVPRVRPRLLYRRLNDSAAPLQVWIDGVLSLEQQIDGQQGIVRLPTLDVGSHDIKILSASGIRWMLNYAGGGDGAYLQRRAQRFRQGDKLSYRYVKQSIEEEVLSARVFLPADSQSQLSVRVAGVPLAPDRVQQDWTVSKREYVVRSTAEATAFVQRGKTTDKLAESQLYIRFGGNLPPGEYPVEVTSSTGGEVLVQFYRILPGLRNQRDTFRYDTGDI